MNDRRQIGGWGEAAADDLQQRGDEIIARNVRTPHGAIELVARRAGLVICVEEKARPSRSLGLPEESIAPRKLAAAEHSAAQNGIDHWQLDATSVEGNPGSKPFIAHLENLSG